MVNFGFKSIKIDSGIKGLQILPIISLCVELKHSNMDCINIFDIEPKLNELLWLILIFILWSKEQSDFLTELLVPLLGHGLVLYRLESIL